MPTLTITKNYQDGIDLDKSMLDAAFDSVSTFLNTTKIDSNNIQVGGIVGSNIAAGTINSDRLAAGTLSTDRIADAAITTVKVADGNITTAKIADGNVTKAKVDSTLAQSFVPSGTLLPYAGATAPTGFLMCDGSAVSRTTYAALFTSIGTLWGTGDGSTTFNLPDMRGYFMRGADNMGTGAAGRDPDAGSRTALGSGGHGVGSTQGQATRKNGLAVSDPGHSHSITYADPNINSAQSGNLGSGGQTSTGTILPATSVTNASSTGISLSNGDNETRPMNIAVAYIIKT